MVAEALGVEGEILLLSFADLPGCLLFCILWKYGVNKNVSRTGNIRVPGIGELTLLCCRWLGVRELLSKRSMFTCDRGVQLVESIMLVMNPMVHMNR